MKKVILILAGRVDHYLARPFGKLLVDFIASRKFLYFSLALWVFGAVTPTIIDWFQK